MKIDRRGLLALLGSGAAAPVAAAAPKTFDGEVVFAHRWDWDTRRPVGMIDAVLRRQQAQRLREEAWHLADDEAVVLDDELDHLVGIGTDAAHRGQFEITHQLGLGHAVGVAREHVGDEPFAVHTLGPVHTQAEASGIHEVKTMYPDVPLIVVSAMPSGEARDACLEAGADMYLEKSTDSSEISQVFQDMLGLSTPDEDGEIPVGEVKLSKRQKQLIVMLDRGLSNREIATELDISEHTVKVHLWRLFRRLGVKSRTQTLHYARSHGLL